MKFKDPSNITIQNDEGIRVLRTLINKHVKFCEKVLLAIELYGQGDYFIQVTAQTGSTVLKIFMQLITFVSL